MSDVRQDAGDDADWVLVLGASSGFGEAAAVAFARAGFHVAGVHLDRRATLPQRASSTGERIRLQQRVPAPLPTVDFAAAA